MLIVMESEEKNPRFCWFWGFFGPNFPGHKVGSGSFPFYSVICGDALDSQYIVKSL